MGKDPALQITLASATVNLEKCLAGKDRGGFLLLVLLQKRGVKCALRVDFFFSSFIWFSGSTFLLAVRMQREQSPWHCSTWAACSAIMLLLWQRQVNDEQICPLHGSESALEDWQYEVLLLTALRLNLRL